ncbi:MAG: response regulator [Candidatus Zixiibacteriota bacterium]|nr:MAG: response regulator [candidate division Zixibacteria bacterium]
MADLASKSILVVDDEEVMREFLYEVLEDFEVEKASDGDEAITKLKARRFDLVITDMKMPRVTGEEVVGFVRKMYPDSKVIVISGYSSLHSVTSTVGYGIDAFLSKPFTINQLRLEVEKALRSEENPDKNGGLK